MNTYRNENSLSTEDIEAKLYVASFGHLGLVMIQTFLIISDIVVNLRLFCFLFHLRRLDDSLQVLASHFTDTFFIR